MRIVYDPAKRAETKKERGLDFLDAEIVFAGRELTVEDSRHDYGERRFQTIGHLAGRMVMMVWTPHGDSRHVISMRKCNAKEQVRYQKRLEAG